MTASTESSAIAASIVAAAQWQLGAGVIEAIATVLTVVGKAQGLTAAQTDATYGDLTDGFMGEVNKALSRYIIAVSDRAQNSLANAS